MQLKAISEAVLQPEYGARLRQLLIRDILLNHQGCQVLFPLLEDQPMQVILCDAFDSSIHLTYEELDFQIKQAGLTPDEADLIPMDSYFVILLKGNVTIRRFRNFSDQSLQDDPNICWIQPCPPNVFLAYGPVVNSASQLPQSLSVALKLRDQRFFWEAQRHILLPHQLQLRGRTPVLTNLLLETYTNRLLQYIQTFNRAQTAKTLQELRDITLRGNDSTNAICLFFTDLYLQIKEQMKNLYQGYTIPFYSNTHIIRSIFQMKCIDEIILFLSQRFDMIMSSIGASSRESVLDDIVHYIKHNFNANITLENIAPLFGYNHSYLGKIFRKKMGQSFNEYVDRLRIEKAKALLLADNAKVYVISERVGYKNVDYFHVKFRKYENMSPAEFRKAHKKVSTSPDGEKLEKGPLFFE